MTKSTTIEKGARVRITAGAAGIIAGVNGLGFVGRVKAGAEGIYTGEHPDARLGVEDWHLIQVERGDDVELEDLEALGYPDDVDLYAPLHSSQFDELVVDAPPNGAIADEVDGELEEGDDGAA